jgi:peptidoglycan L-alanyl-D-glutamate endopeptidase CwlK
MSRNLDDLDTACAAKFKKLYDDMKNDKLLKEMGVTGIYISETRRELAVQMAYYSRSRMSVADVKRMYAAAGLYKISDEEAKTANTQTLSSRHIQGKAMDLVPEIDGIVAWNAAEKVWNRMGDIAKADGVEWGGSWDSFKDKPHFQID